VLEQQRPPHWNFAVLHTPEIQDQITSGYAEGVTASDMGFPVLHVRTRRVGPGRDLLWQGMPPFGVDNVRAIITDTQIRNLTYALAPFVCKVRQIRWGAWGHVKDHQASLRGGLTKKCTEWFKRIWLRQADHFFAYTDDEATLARQRLGLPEDRITTMMNTIDVVREIEAARKVQSCGGRPYARQHLGLPTDPSCRVVLTVSRLVKERNLSGLLPTVREVLRADHSTQWVVIGDGPDRPVLEPLTEEFPGRFHLLGAITDRTVLSHWYAAADLFALYGFVGLGVVQAFAHGLFAVVWDGQPHSPEIAYCSAKNSIRIPSGLDSREEATLIRRVLEQQARDPQPDAVRGTVEHLTLQSMANRMIDGIDRMLGTFPVE
jgi:glycosyltransferase involved in cell wall biosynthesis